MKKRAVEYLQHKLEYEAKTYTKKKLQAKNKWSKVVGSSFFFSRYTRNLVVSKHNKVNISIKSNNKDF